MTVNLRRITANGGQDLPNHLSIRSFPIVSAHDNLTFVNNKIHERTLLQDITILSEPIIKRYKNNQCIGNALNIVSRIDESNRLRYNGHGLRTVDDVIRITINDHKTKDDNSWNEWGEVISI